MDTSKLPKLSNTPPPPPPTPEADAHSPPHSRQPNPPGIGGEIWFSLIIGILLMSVGRSFGSYALASLTGRTYDTRVTWMAGPKAGQPVGYWELESFTALTDSGIFLFGLAMVIEAAALAAIALRLGPRRAILAVAMLIAAAVTAYNLVVVIRLFSAGITPIWSMLAVAFGGYMTAHLWKVYRYVSRGEAAPMT